MTIQTRIDALTYAREDAAVVGDLDDVEVVVDRAWEYFFFLGGIDLTADETLDAEALLGAQGCFFGENI